MVTVLLAGMVGLAVVGCGCVVWASRGGPRWVRGVARVTLAAGEGVRRQQRRSRGGGWRQNQGDSDGD
ncbi:hypothetical protein [Streptomyces griseus]|uniref:hypothetical protein n=1 Tax=Streptomyces griseus TaxID=1911 RepID=UPI0004C9BAF8|nr:hypothetical protein [Streptomyces griseus]